MEDGGDGDGWHTVRLCGSGMMPWRGANAECMMHWHLPRKMANPVEDMAARNIIVTPRAAYLSATIAVVIATRMGAYSQRSDEAKCRNSTEMHEIVRLAYDGDCERSNALELSVDTCESQAIDDARQEASHRQWY